MTTHPNGRPTPRAVPTVPPPPPGGTTGVAGPLSQAVAEATARATRSRLDDDPHRAWDRTGGGRPALVPKRLLVAVSHAIEKAVVSSPIGGPGPSTVVIALFQRLEFFERERVVYERLAAAGAEVVVGFVRGEEHAPPRGVHTVLIEPDEKLADEWTVVAVGPRAGAFLVATDQHAYDAREHDVEASRQFSGRWGYAHAQAGAGSPGCASPWVGGSRSRCCAGSTACSARPWPRAGSRPGAAGRRRRRGRRRRWRT